MYILGIETSCDETGVAIYDTNKKRLIANQLHSQIDLHQHYGGVIPELASRDHIAKLPRLLQAALSEANIALSELDGVAYTAKPGLIGALMVGASFAKSLAFSQNIKSIAIHHLEGHLLAPMLDSEIDIDYPYIALLVSGGHTQFILVSAFGQYQLLGQTIDDAAGEAFDKTAKLLGLAYPGGPALAKLAQQGRNGVYHFTRPMVNRPGLEMSFSGLKTAVMQAWQQADQHCQQTKADIACAFEQALVDTLLIKAKRALKQTSVNCLVVAGGVSANVYLRQQFAKKLSAKIIYPPLSYCTDNGAMIALAGAYRIANGDQDSDWSINVAARAPLNNAVES